MHRCEGELQAARLSLHAERRRGEAEAQARAQAEAEALQALGASLRAAIRPSETPQRLETPQRWRAQSDLAADAPPKSPPRGDEEKGPTAGLGREGGARGDEARPPWETGLTSEQAAGGPVVARGGAALPATTAPACTLRDLEELAAAVAGQLEETRREVRGARGRRLVSLSLSFV